MSDEFESASLIAHPEAVGIDPMPDRLPLVETWIAGPDHLWWAERVLGEVGGHGQVTADDLRVEKDGVTVLVDEMSVPFLEGSILDYVDDLIGASFQVKNPNATANCGCGTSFSV